jgi:hypothetical protein
VLFVRIMAIANENSWRTGHGCLLASIGKQWQSRE